MLSFAIGYVFFGLISVEIAVLGLKKLGRGAEVDTTFYVLSILLWPVCVATTTVRLLMRTR